MEPNELDKIFKDQIEKDSSALNFDELQSKNLAWEKLEINEGEKVVAKSRKFWGFLSLAAAMLLIGFGAFSFALYDKLQTQNNKYQALEIEYNKVTNEVEKVSEQILRLDEKLSTQLASAEANEETVSEALAQVVTANSFEKEVQYVEKQIYVRDTVFSVKRIEQVEVVKYIKDTIYLKSEIPESSMIAEIEEAGELESDKAIENSRLPKKVEFVFGKKPTKRKREGIRILINGAEVARKGN